MVEKPRAFDPRGRSCADPRKRFYFDPLSPDFQGSFYFAEKGQRYFARRGQRNSPSGVKRARLFQKQLFMENTGKKYGLLLLF